MRALPLAQDGAEELQDAFDRSPADGLFYLGSQGLESQLSPPFVFWRELARRFFQEVCHLGAVPLGQWQRIEPPAEEELQALVLSAPPMRGLEYLSTELLRRLWRELRELVVEQAGRHPEGAEAYLRSVNPLWHLLGRVTFHLAENKRDPRRPFAFLATYTHRMTAGARLQHLPLAEALKEYAGAKRPGAARLFAGTGAARRGPDARSCANCWKARPCSSRKRWTIAQALPFSHRGAAHGSKPAWWSACRTGGAHGGRRGPQVQVRIGQTVPGERWAWIGCSISRSTWRSTASR